MDKVWLVGQVMHRMGDGAVLWRKLGVFRDRTTAAFWARYTGADLLLAVEPGTPTPAFGEIGASVVKEPKAMEG